MPSGLKYSSVKETKMQGVQPGTAQEIPELAKYVILVLAIIAVVLTAGWGKIMDMLRSKSARKSEPAPKEEK